MKLLEKHFDEEKTPGESRLVMLCDGVFAIALTLLVLDIKPSLPPDKLPFDSALPQIFSQIVIYLVTFYVLAIYWLTHHQLMQLVKRLDNVFIWLTFLFLAFITFFPASASLMQLYGNEPQARDVVIFYTLSFAGCGFSSSLLWLYASWKHRLIDEKLNNEAIRNRTLKILSAPVFFSLSLLLLFFFPPEKIFYSWTLLGIVPGLFKVAQRAFTRVRARRNSESKDEQKLSDQDVSNVKQTANS